MAVMAKYQPAKGAMYSKKQATALGRVLESLGQHVTPAQVVESARSVRSPIHGMFEWDNTAAAEQYRLWQARSHVNHLEICIETPDGDIETRAYHSVVIVNADDRVRGYSHMSDVRNSPALADQVIAKALRELDGWQQRYDEYRDVFGQIFKAIKKVKATRGKRVASRKQLRVSA